VPAPPARKGDKQEGAAKKNEPFRDRVLDKALEYIKGEIKNEKKDARAPHAALPMKTALRIPAWQGGGQLNRWQLDPRPGRPMPVPALLERASDSARQAC